MYIVVNLYFTGGLRVYQFVAMCPVLCNVFIYIDSCGLYLFIIYLFIYGLSFRLTWLSASNKFGTLLYNNKKQKTVRTYYAFCRSEFDLPYKGLELTYCTLHMLEGIIDMSMETY